MDSPKTANGHCRCGASSFTLTGTPIIRLLCHCTICQRFSKAAFSDTTVFRARDVQLPSDAPIHFDSYRPPPNVQRGQCTACNNPAIEVLSMPLVPRFYIVPSANIDEPSLVPEPAMHLFYEHRIAEAQDDLPKYSGYWPSQLAMIRQLLVNLLRG